MKKNLFGWLAMAAMLVGTGCSTDEVVNDYSPENAIQFGTYVGRDAQGRANVISADNIAEQGFGVFAYYTDEADFSASATPNFMFNQKVLGIGFGADGVETSVVSTDPNYPGTKWENGWYYTPLKYWPNEATDKLSFFAYAPHKAANSENFELFANTVSGDPIITFNVNSIVKNQEDFLYSEPILNKCKANGGVGVDDQVVFNFKHALARIGFNIETIVDQIADNTTGQDDDNVNDNATSKDAATTVYIDQVELIGSFYNKGKFNLNSNVWDEKIYTAGLTTYTLEKTSNFNSVLVTTTKQKLNADDSYIMIIPKYFDGSTEENTLRIKTTYRVLTGDPALPNGKSEVTNVITSEPFSLNFEMGKAYTFSLQLGLTSVKLTASVADWTTGKDVAVNVPINTGTTIP